MASLPKVGLNVVPVPSSLLVRFARLAEDMGFESLWSGEHVCLPANEDWWRGYPTVTATAARGEPVDPSLVPFTPHSPFHEPLIVLSHLAAVTSRVRLGVGIYLLALRDAVLVGRALASLDVLSGGRIDLGVGLGWSPEEYAYTGNDWHKRGRKLDETILALRALFEQDEPEFHGEFYDFPKIGFQPKPVQRPFPIHVGGFTPAAERRAARLGNGWYGGPAHIPSVKAQLAEQGRADEPFTFGMIEPRGMIERDELLRLADQGVDRVVTTVWPQTLEPSADDPDAPLRELEAYARRIGLV
ncbi:TIGR03619 family F420-dependent LLM class oxidoreductase [Novosphingobium sp.]|uniref:TIGR03619 family F420-dependent LLM class oxidoreductase n=1 Tax=Novosphingobium sp. TaxID=1874826 RepID=UPI0035AD9695